jgi:phage terminase large subunit-like protein
LWKAFLQKNFSGAGEDSLSRGSYAHGVHPVLQWCASNAVVTRDPAGGRKFDKAKSTGLIDALVPLAMALSLALLLTEKPIDIRALIG